jgi:hypothetical protein
VLVGCLPPPAADEPSERRLAPVIRPETEHATGASCAPLPHGTRDPRPGPLRAPTSDSIELSLSMRSGIGDAGQRRTTKAAGDAGADTVWWRYRAHAGRLTPVNPPWSTPINAPACARTVRTSAYVSIGPARAAPDAAVVSKLRSGPFGQPSGSGTNGL